MGKLLTPVGERCSNISEDVQIESERGDSTKKDRTRTEKGSQGPGIGPKLGEVKTERDSRWGSVKTQGTKTPVSCVLDKCSITELHPSPSNLLSYRLIRDKYAQIKTWFPSKSSLGPWWKSLYIYLCQRLQMSSSLHQFKILLFTINPSKTFQ